MHRRRRKDRQTDGHKHRNRKVNRDRKIRGGRDETITNKKETERRQREIASEAAKQTTAPRNKHILNTRSYEQDCSCFTLVSQVYAHLLFISGVSAQSPT